MRLAKLLIPCLLLTAMATTSHAQQNGLGMSLMYGYGGGYGYQNYAMTTYNNSMPYFSLHPPVYYGQRYTRPYGVSPFAAWPQLQTNAAYAPAMHVNRTLCRPMVIVNPHMSDEVTTGIIRDGHVAMQPVQPRVIENPYFESPAVQLTSK